MFAIALVLHASAWSKRQRSAHTLLAADAPKAAGAEPTPTLADHLEKVDRLFPKECGSECQKLKATLALQHREKEMAALVQADKNTRGPGKRKKGGKAGGKAAPSIGARNNIKNLQAKVREAKREAKKEAIIAKKKKAKKLKEKAQTSKDAPRETDSGSKEDIRRHRQQLHYPLGEGYQDWNSTTETSCWTMDSQVDDSWCNSNCRAGSTMGDCNRMCCCQVSCDGWTQKSMPPSMKQHAQNQTMGIPPWGKRMQKKRLSIARPKQESEGEQGEDEDEENEPVKSDADNRKAMRKGERGKMKQQRQEQREKRKAQKEEARKKQASNQAEDEDEAFDDEDDADRPSRTTIPAKATKKTISVLQKFLEKEEDFERRLKKQEDALKEAQAKRALEQR